MNLPIKLANDFNFKNYTILVIDDSPANLSIIITYLEEQGFETMAAKTGKEGLEMTQYSPNLILLDVMLPDINGFEVCRRLKLDEATKEIPVIFMTALTSVKDKVEGFEAGGLDYITKPIQYQELLARILTHLNAHNLNQKLQQANQELHTLNTNKNIFFSIMAQDLKSSFIPLVKTSADLVETAQELKLSHFEGIAKKLQNRANNTYNLFNSLLEWSQLQMGAINYHPLALNLSQIIKQNITLQTPKAIKKSISVKSLLNPFLMVYADEYMLNTIVSELLSNAIKFTPKDGQITISARRTKDKTKSNKQPTVQVSVTDTGIGFSPSNLKRLFKINTYYTTPGTANEQGTGLGLILCQEMLLKHNSKIWVESTLHQGSTINFNLPIHNIKPGLQTNQLDVLVETLEVDQTPPQTISTESLIIPPPQEMDVLYALAKRGNMRKIKKWADQLSQSDIKYNQLATKIHQLAAAYEGEQILDLAKKYVKPVSS